MLTDESEFDLALDPRRDAVLYRDAGDDECHSVGGWDCGYSVHYDH